MDEHTQSAETMPAANLKPPLPQPPLSISQLMLWILGSAIILGVNRAMHRQPSASETLRIIEVGYQVGLSGFYGIKLGALFVFLSRAIRRDGPLPREPGHWLLFNGGIVAAIAWPAFLLLFPRDLGTEFNVIFRAVAVFSVVVYTVTCTLSVAAIIGTFGRRAVLWQFLFGYVFLTGAVTVITAITFLIDIESSNTFSREGIFLEWHQLLPWIEQVPVLVAMCSFLLWDRWRGKKWDWLHYVGVATEMGMTLLLIAMMIARQHLAG